MQEDIQVILDETKEMMNKAVKHVAEELGKIRAGKAMPSMLDSVKVDYYGAKTPLNQVSSVNTLDARTIIVKPWEKTIIGDIEKAIMAADLGLNPQNDGENIIINIPSLTEERRQELVKQAKHEGEEGKISIRNARQEAISQIKELKDEGVSEDDIKVGEDKVQELTDVHGEKIDQLVQKKEEDIMHV